MGRTKFTQVHCNQCCGTIDNFHTIIQKEVSASLLNRNAIVNKHGDFCSISCFHLFKYENNLK